MVMVHVLQPKSSALVPRSSWVLKIKTTQELLGQDLDLRALRTY
eukprot:SAG31_NODE_3075_length_4712_cov_2.262302_1_plen_43_part_10